MLCEKGPDLSAEMSKNAIGRNLSLSFTFRTVCLQFSTILLFSACRQCSLSYYLMHVDSVHYLTILCMSTVFTILLFSACRLLLLFSPFRQCSLYYYFMHVDSVHYSLRGLMIIIATGLISLSPLSVVSTMIM